MESRFGHDFSRVRIHTDEKAAESARAVNALAYTAGHDIVFGAGQYVPETPEGRRLLAHEMTHVVQQRASLVPTGVVQRAPADPIAVTLVEVPRSESDLLFHDIGLRLPGSPPRVRFGDDGPVAESDRKMVQLAFDLAYGTAASPSFATRLGEFKGSMGKEGAENIAGLSALGQQKYLDALNRMVIHLADTSTNPLVVKSMQVETGKSAGPPTAGFTPIGTNNVYIRAFAIKEGRDALASLILHESFHVAGVPARPINEFLEYIMEAAVHGFEASAGLPLSQIVLRAASIQSVNAQGQGLDFTVSVTEPDQLESTLRIEILDGNRNMVFLQERPTKKFTERFVWNGLDGSGKPTESGMHSIRVVSGNALYAARDYVVRRAKT